MRKPTWLLAAAVVLQSQIARAQELPVLPSVSPSAGDLYIGCSLYIRDTEVAYTDKVLSDAFRSMVGVTPHLKLA